MKKHACDTSVSQLCATRSVCDDHKLLAEIQHVLARAQREGANYVYVPRWMLEQLIEKAQRPHD